MKVVPLLWLVALAGACSSAPSHTISAGEFDRSCTVDSDCVAVYEGTLGCCGPGCSNAAINNMSYSAYQAAVSTREPTCSPALPCPAFTNVVCRSGAICANGTCQFQQLSTDASSLD